MPMTITSNPASGLISSPGLGSGLNVNQLVTQLVAAEKKPGQTQIDNQRAEVTAQTSAVGNLKSLLAALQSSVSSLASGSAFAKVTTASSDPDLFTASASDQAAPGSYQIEVLQMAAAQKLASGAFASDAAVGSGTLTLAVGGKSTDITIDSSNNTLAGIRDAINGAKDNPGVSATIVHAADGDHLLMTATTSGAANAFSVSASGGDGGLDALTWDASTATGSLAVQTAASDAQVKIDGFAATSSTNIVDSAIQGVSLDLASAKPGQVETLTVARDTQAMQNLVSTFVNAYNSFVKGAQQLASYNPDSKAAGPLLGDATLRTIRMQLSSVLAGAGGTDNADLHTLGDLGISLQADGTLGLDADKLGNGLQAHPDQVAALFDNAAGYGARMKGLLNGYLGSGGLLGVRSTSLQQESKALDDQQSQLDARMQSVQDRYLKQFTALDVTMSQMNQTSTFLTSQLNMLSSIYQPASQKK